MQIADKYDYLVHLIYCAVNGVQPQEKPENITFEEILNAGIEHKVDSIAYLSILKLNNKPDQDLMRLWREYHYIAIRRDARQENAKNKILSAFHQNGINTLEVQGTRVKKYHPFPFLRYMADIDFIIEKKNLCLAEELLKQQGLETEMLQDFEINAHGENAISVEVHSDYFKPSTPQSKMLKVDFENAKVENGNIIVDDTEFLLFHLLHCVKHYVSAGVGIRRIADLYFLKNALKDSADWQKINECLEHNGLKKDLDDLFAVADYWFETAPENESIKDVIEEIKSAGKHGTMEIRLKHSAKSNGTGKFSRLRTLCRTVFPSKEAIYYSYPFCAKHKLPIFFCWIYRLGYIVFVPSKRKNVKKYVKYLNDENN